MADSDEIITVAEAARLLGYKSSSSVIRRIERGDIPAKRLFEGAPWKIKRGDIDRILSGGGLGPEEDDSSKS